MPARIFRARRILLGLCAAAALTPPAQAQDGQFSFSTGADYTTGDYGESDDTTIIVVPFAAAYRTERWSAGITTPYVSLDGTGTIIPGGASGVGGSSFGGGLLDGVLGAPSSGGATPAPTPTPTRVEEQGIGDVTLSLSATPYRAETGARFTIASDVRLPTGDADRSLGAGETIGSVAGVYAHPLGDRSSLTAGLGYQQAFDSDQGGAIAGIGASTEFGQSMTFGASVDWAASAIDGRRDQTTASLFLGADATEHVRIVGYALAGLTETSPDAGAGVRLVFSP